MRHVNFNQSLYTNAVKKAIARAISVVDRNVYRAMYTNLSSVNLRQVDSKYIGEMLSSIRSASTETYGRIVTTFLAGGEQKPNQSFRVIYYEYGTGELMQPPPGYSPASDPYWNPGRPKGKSPHYTRSDHSYQDLGGNWHRNPRRDPGKVPTPRPIPQSNVFGEYIQPSQWFSRAFDQGTKDMDKLILNAVRSVPITAYIGIRDIKKRM